MKAVVYHGINDIRFEEVPDPQIQEDRDAIVRITASAICGTDLHMIRGTMPGMKKGTILGHEGVGYVEEVGKRVRNFQKGDRVVIASTIACGYCSYCRSGYFSQCDNANPNGQRAGTCFFGGPADTGSIDGMQAERVRVPFSNIGMVKIPEDVTDEQALMLSDIFPTGYFGAEIAHIRPGHTVAVFGCGPVGLFSIMSSFLMGAGQVIAVDKVESRLEKARELGAEIVNFEEDDPIEAILDLTGGIGVDRAIEAVGIDAEFPEKGPAAKKVEQQKDLFETELQQIQPDKEKVKEHNGHPGPSQALQWSVDSLSKAGNLSIIGFYPPNTMFFPFGQALNKNITVHMGNCNHRRYIPMLMEFVQSGEVRPEKLITNRQPLESVLEAYKMFDEHKPGWIKIELIPTGKT